MSLITGIRLVYLVTFILSMIFTVLLVLLLKNKASVYYFILFFSITIECFGFLQLSCAQNLQAAIFANQVLYFGACCTPIFCMLCITELCNAKHNYILEIILALAAAIVFTGVCTAGYSSIYYKDIGLLTTPGFSYLTKDYGPLHIVYPIYLITAITYTLILIIKSYNTKKQISYITNIVLTFSMTVVVIVYFVERLLKLNMDFIPQAFVCLQIAILFLLRRINRYDLWGLSAASIGSTKNYGFLIVNSKQILYGADSVSRMWFPELNELSIDRKIDPKNSPFLNQICKLIENPNTEEIVYFEQNNKIIELKQTLVQKRKLYYTYCFNLRDDTHQQKLAKLMKNYNSELELQVTEKTARLTNVQNDIILSMASIVENRDSNTGGHIRRTSDIVRIFVRHLEETKKYPQLTKKTADYIIKAAPLHDFGKIGIPDVVLNKPGKFNNDEYEIMKLHPTKGAAIVAEILQNSGDEEFRNIAINVAHYHHEKWDKSGYPEKLSGQEIPLEARIMALADVFDALVSKRVYKNSLSYDVAFKIIEESCGSHFDPELCSEFLQCRPQLEALFETYTD